MRSFSTWSVGRLNLTVVACLAVVGATLAADTKSSGKDGGKGEATSTRRLPPYFAGVVKNDQREKILAVRGRYAARIEKKRAELESLLAERDAEVWKLLTPAQRKQIERLRAEAQANRADAAEDQEMPLDE